MRTLIHNALGVDVRGEEPGTWVLFSEGLIVAAGTGAPPTDDLPSVGWVVDAAGARLVPGFVDLHCHGGGGSSFEDGAAAIAAALATHRAHGTTRSVVSFVAAPVQDLARRLALVAELTASDPLVLGSHLEGPFLSPARRGAHAAEALTHPEHRSVESLLTAARGTLRQATIAPELPGALEAIDALVAAGCAVAVGHTDADAAGASAAFDRGATLLTHAFNAMAGIEARRGGPIGAAVADDRVTLELILDGRHVDSLVARLLFAAAPGRIALVTDSMAAAGSGDGAYLLGTLPVTVRDGTATLDGAGTLAGSTLTQDAALRRAVLELGIDPADAVAAVTSTPARALGLDDRFGLLAEGYAADAVLLDADWRVQRVWADGRELPTV
ncbi:N-acetylglucosamine-6-phosphate deacetylase [Lysobacter korlensis]|uniref:N-acetylglucosamine-6-phosphate deacetylase n=1 Tax=Lysobacter korlensis TaxID=553636 RepID=A0ABV6RV22_9GAMM